SMVRLPWFKLVHALFLLIPEPAGDVKRRHKLLRRRCFQEPADPRAADIPRRPLAADHYGWAMTLRSMSRTLFTPHSAMLTSSSRASMSIAAATPASPPAPRP